MANTSAWIAGNGVGLTWTASGFTLANFNSLAYGSCVVAATAINNTTALDLYADVSFVLTVGGTTTSGYIALYVMPLNQDGTTYGDGTVTGATPPNGTYQVGAAGTRTGITTGNPITGMIRGVLLPPGNFLFSVANQSGIALSATANAVVNYRTYNENLNR
jgi:hypothetical protein